MIAGPGRGSAPTPTGDVPGRGRWTTSTTSPAEFDVAVAINSLVMPDVRDIDRTLRPIRAALKPGGVFLGVLPSIDAIHYHTMLLLDHELDHGPRPRGGRAARGLPRRAPLLRVRLRPVHVPGPARRSSGSRSRSSYRLTKAGFPSVDLDQRPLPLGRPPPGRRPTSPTTPELGLVVRRPTMTRT